MNVAGELGKIALGAKSEGQLRVEPLQLVQTLVDASAEASPPEYGNSTQLETVAQTCH